MRTMVELNKIKKELRAEFIHKNIDEAIIAANNDERKDKNKNKEKVTCRKGTLFFFSTNILFKRLSL